MNSSQMEAIHHLEGPLMVLAGPGSGKTTVITHRAVQLIKEKGIPPSQILVVTFSKAAATEMASRFRDLSDVASNNTNCTFGTFHSIFFRVLRKRYGFGVEQVMQENERREMIRKLIDFETDKDVLSSIRNEISLVKNELYDLQHYNSTSIGADEFRELFLRYEEFKKGINKIDFDDMLTLCLRLWQQEPENLTFWQRQFPYIMIDEFQDINHVQYECLKMLSASPHHLCIVGDDDQSIYRFRGARPEFLLQFPKDYPNVKRVLLETNYRSTDQVIAFSNRIIAKNRIRYDKIIVGTGKTGPTPKLVVCEDQNSEAISIAKRIKKHMAENSPADYNEVAIIYRTNMQARAFVDAFLQSNIPFVVKDEISVIYEHWIALDIFAYLRGDAERVINKPFRYISTAFLKKAKQERQNIFEFYTRSEMLNAAQQQRIEELIIDMMAIKKLPTAKAIKYIRNRAGYDSYIKDHCEYRKISPSGLYEIAAELQESAEAFPDPSDFMAHAEEVIESKNQESNRSNRVSLSTMHSAKGLEFDTVYIAGCVEGLIPHEHSKTSAELEEERRLFYVGATRAKRQLYITTIKKRHEKKAKISRFI